MSGQFLHGLQNVKFTKMLPTGVFLLDNVEMDCQFNYSKRICLKIEVRAASDHFTNVKERFQKVRCTAHGNGQQPGAM